MRWKLWVAVAVLSVALVGCQNMSMKSGSSEFVKPDIQLEMFEVPQYDGYWYYSKGVEPTKGEPDDRGAPLPMSFLFSVNNPNSQPALIEELKFTVAFEGFSVVTVNMQDDYWIPANKTDHVRATTMITVRSALLNLLVTGGFQLKEKGMTAWDTLERWWTGVPDLSVPVQVTEGTVIYRTADGKSVVDSFSFTFPPAE
ncbi:MAG: hypothetical protein ACLFOY_15620 [Desulfatibacillaceae bacterium]